MSEDEEIDTQTQEIVLSNLDDSLRLHFHAFKIFLFMSSSKTTTAAKYCFSSTPEVKPKDGVFILFAFICFLFLLSYKYSFFTQFNWQIGTQEDITKRWKRRGVCAYYDACYSLDCCMKSKSDRIYSFYFKLNKGNVLLSLKWDWLSISNFLQELLLHGALDQEGLKLKASLNNSCSYFKSIDISTVQRKRSPGV